MSRLRLSPLTQTTFDLLIIGGGIVGAGIARDAALRGLSVALVEQHDFGAGTTSGSTRLIHGGLRYLEMLDFPLVRLDLRERETLLRIAPHLVKPLEFVLPFYDESLFARMRLRAGMWLYDTLSFDKSLPRHRVLSAREVRSLEPALASTGLVGGASYFDAQAAMPERLCLENLLDAGAHGAQVVNYARAVEAVREGDRLVGVRVRDVVGGEGDVEVRARLVVNATGAWLDRLGTQVLDDRRPRLRTTKGVHLACPATTSRAIAVPSNVDGRLVFVIPWLGYTWIGTTDTDFDDDPALARADASDVAYLRASVQRYVPALADAPVYFTNAGVRALVRQTGHESSVSRSHRLIDGERDGLRGLISVVGGKLTGYRAIAEEATDLACRKLGSGGRSTTAREPLPGAGSPGAAGGLPVEALAPIYGARMARLAELVAHEALLAEPLAPTYPDVAAQVVLAARDEHCVRLSDFLLRRTRLGFTIDQGRAALPRVADILTRELGWSPYRRASEIAAYEAYVDSTQAWRHEPGG